MTRVDLESFFATKAGKEWTLNNYKVTLRGFCRKFESMLGTVIGFFNFCYERPSLEDKIIDWVIAFENVLLTEKMELGLKLGFRTANLLGKSVEEKHEILRFMSVAFLILTFRIDLEC